MATLIARLRERAAAGDDLASEAADEIERLRVLFRVNIIRLNPSISHAEIDAILDRKE